MSTPKALPKLLLPDAMVEIEPQVAALSHVLSDPTVPEQIRQWVRAEVVAIVARAHERAAQESEGERA